VRTDPFFNQRNRRGPVVLDRSRIHAHSLFAGAYNGMHTNTHVRACVRDNINGSRPRGVLTAMTVVCPPPPPPPVLFASYDRTCVPHKDNLHNLNRYATRSDRPSVVVARVPPAICFGLRDLYIYYTYIHTRV